VGLTGGPVTLEKKKVSSSSWQSNSESQLVHPTAWSLQPTTACTVIFIRTVTRKKTENKHGTDEKYPSKVHFG
jgi:hypothetical protein